MRIVTCLFVLLFAAVSPSMAADDAVSLRVRFGMKDREGKDWSGKIEPAEGSVESIRGWRWMPGDHAKGNEFTVATRRAAAQSRGERQRVQAGQKLPVRDNGFIATIAGTKPDTTIRFTSGGGNAEFKLSDVAYGKPHTALDGNLLIERVPAATELAGTLADEDYPAIARAKDGTLYPSRVRASGRRRENPGPTAARSRPEGSSRSRSPRTSTTWPSRPAASRSSCACASPTALGKSRSQSRTASTNSTAPP
jgi:hypothetical protein